MQEPESEQEPESSKFFRSRLRLGVEFNVKVGVEVGAGVTISLSFYCNQGCLGGGGGWAPLVLKNVLRGAQGGPNYSNHS